MQLPTSEDDTCERHPEKNVKFWDINTGECLSTIYEHDESVNDVVFHPDQPELLFTASLDGTVKMWELEF